MRSSSFKLPVLLTLVAALSMVVAVAAATIPVQASPQEAAEIGVQIVEGTLSDINTWVFEPSAVEVRVGDTIVWTNMGAIDHDATARSFASRTIPPGASFSWTATEAGTISYDCDFHPWMTGTIVVTE